ncbi:MAG TPA: hypothetical protein VMH86_09935 [Rhizomicrobium sp.]|nr:hypothetical protein [Rhizomicrobium sp.]
MNKLFLIAVAAAFPLAASAADLSGEIATAAQHADLASQASDIAGVHTHLHHTLNCLVGPKGDGFDPKELNPCANSGNGAIPDAANDAAKLKVLKSAATNAQVGLRENNLFTAQQTAAHIAKKLKAIH